MTQPIAPLSFAKKSNRDEKRRKQRESLSSALKDPLVLFSKSLKPDFREVSLELAEQREQLKERVRTASASSQELLESFSPSRAKQYVKDREPLLEAMAFHNRACRNALREQRDTKTLDKLTYKRLLSGVEENDIGILRERAALARNHLKLECGILTHPTHARIGEAYLMALVSNLSEPAGAKIKKTGTRNKNDQERFRNIVRNAYSPKQGSPEYDGPKTELPVLWCPVTRAWHEQSNTKTAHIVPYAIGEYNVAYIFGLPLDQGWEALWWFDNGLILHPRIEAHFDDARIVIVPDEESGKELKLVVLDDSLLNEETYPGGPRYRELNHERLVFKTESRPKKRYLYFHCLTTLFRRHRYMVPGCEKDQEKIQMGKIWGTPGNWMRAGVIQALALEIGDILQAERIVDGDVKSDVFPEPLSPLQERKIAVQVHEVFARKDVDEDDEKDWEDGEDMEDWGDGEDGSDEDDD